MVVDYKVFFEEAKIKLNITGKITRVLEFSENPRQFSGEMNRVAELR